MIPNVQKRLKKIVFLFDYLNQIDYKLNFKFSIITSLIDLFATSFKITFQIQDQLSLVTKINHQKYITISRDSLITYKNPTLTLVVVSLKKLVSVLMDFYLRHPTIVVFVCYLSMIKLKICLPVQPLVWMNLPENCTWLAQQQIVTKKLSYLQPFHRIVSYWSQDAEEAR